MAKTLFTKCNSIASHCQCLCELARIPTASRAQPINMFKKYFSDLMLQMHLYREILHINKKHFTVHNPRCVFIMLLIAYSASMTPSVSSLH